MSHTIRLIFNILTFYYAVNYKNQCGEIWLAIYRLSPIIPDYPKGKILEPHHELLFYCLPRLWNSLQIIKIVAIFRSEQCEVEEIPLSS